MCDKDILSELGEQPSQQMGGRLAVIDDEHAMRRSLGSSGRIDC